MQPQTMCAGAGPEIWLQFQPKNYLQTPFTSIPFRVVLLNFRSKVLGIMFKRFVILDGFPS